MGGEGREDRGETKGSRILGYEIKYFPTSLAF